MSFDPDKKTYAVGSVHVDDVDLNNQPTEVVEAAVIEKLTEEDIYKISRDALELWSMTGLRILGIMFVQGCNQAGYGIDWAVIGGKSHIRSWRVFEKLHR